MDRYLLIERDGGVNVRTEEGVVSPEKLMILPFVQEAFFALHQKKIKTIILSDQSAIVPSKIDLSGLDPIHEKMKATVELLGGKVTDVIVNPNSILRVDHSTFPQSGLFLIAAKKYGLNLQETPFIASSYEGLQAGWAAKCRTSFVKTGKPFKTLQALRTSKVQPEYIFQDLLEAVTRLFPT